MNAIHVSSSSVFGHPCNPAGYFPSEFVPRTYKSLIDSGAYTFLWYLAFRVQPLLWGARLLWERSLRSELYPTIGSFVAGRRPPADNKDAAWRQLEGVNLDAAEAVKSRVTIPVISTGSFQTLEGIQAALDEGKCDAVSIARALLANHNLPNEILKASREKETAHAAERPCTLCNRCLLAVLENPMGCYDDSRFAHIAGQAHHRGTP